MSKDWKFKILIESANEKEQNEKYREIERSTMNIGQYQEPFSTLLH